MNGPSIRAVLVALAWLFPAAPLAAAEPAWVEPMKKVHAKFTGQRGTVAQIGDSITITMAFFTPIRGQVRNLPEDLEPAHQWIRSYVQGRCWAGWKGPEWGNNGRMTSNWGAANIDGWLKKMNPEVALVMFGTNDLHAGPRPPEYDQKMRKIAQACIDNGTVPILYTIPPVANQLNDPKRTKYVETFVEAVRKLAAELKVPLIDFYKEMITRRPKDFPVLLGDNVHPSYPKQYQRDFSDEALRNSGYTLRNYLTLKMYWQVYRQVLSQVESARTTTAETTWKGPMYEHLPALLVPRPAAAPKVNGRLDDACWKALEPIRFRLLDGNPKGPACPTWAKLAATESALFVAFHCNEPD
ncbi:MAG: GDSL-type esterase/lipase family protein, partial [Phycisphaerae bacterium]